CVWLFRRDKDKVRVVNEGMPVNNEEVARFASWVFNAYPAVNVISFHAVQTMPGQLQLPHQRFNCLEDIVATLPPSAEEYLGGLGKATRSYLHRYLNKLRRDFPQFRLQVCEAQEIDERDILRIIEFNRMRMASKGKASINNDDVAQRIVRFARERGMVCIISLGGRLCAGTINYRVRDNYFLETLAHDPAYDDYRLGTLCCYLSICECIARGGKEYHFLWGQDDYKSRLHGVQRDLDDLVVYRSHLHMLLHGDAVLQHAAHAGVRRAQVWLRGARRQHRVAARIVDGALQTLRALGSTRTP
ncbi:MAG: GNAT family N-acetyltransferase, partial [Noviherbaspirillum sp.]